MGLDITLYKQENFDIEDSCDIGYWRKYHEFLDWLCIYHRNKYASELENGGVWSLEDEDIKAIVSAFKTKKIRCNNWWFTNGKSAKEIKEAYTTNIKIFEDALKHKTTYKCNIILVADW